MYQLNKIDNFIALATSIFIKYQQIIFHCSRFIYTLAELCKILPGIQPWGWFQLGYG